MNGVTELLQEQLSDRELLRQFKEVEKIESADKHLAPFKFDFIN